MKTFKAEGDTFKQKARLRQLGWRWFPEKYEWRITVESENHNAIRMLRRIGLTCKEVKND